MPRPSRRLHPVALALTAVVAAAGCGDDRDADRAKASRTLTAPPAHRVVGPKRLPEPTDPAGRAVLAAAREVGPIRHGGGRRYLAALTFDDGPGPYTGRLLSVLRRTGTPATFFQVGRSLDANPYPARATALLDDVEIGDHTYTHRSLRGMPFAAQQAEIVSTAASMTAHGERAPRIFRPPYGAYDATTVRLMDERGMALVLWSVDSRDYTRPGVRRIVENVVSAVRPGSIVLMHDGGGERSQTAKALPRIIRRLRAKGYGLVTVPELLMRDPPRREDQGTAGATGGAG